MGPGGIGMKLVIVIAGRSRNYFRATSSLTITSVSSVVTRALIPDAVLVRLW